MLLTVIMCQDNCSSNCVEQLDCVKHSLIPQHRNLRGFIFILFFDSLLVSGPDCATLGQGYMQLSGAVPWRGSTAVSASVWL